MTAKFSPFRRIIKIAADLGIYLESGFLDLLSVGQCTENAYKPAILNYDSATEVYVSGTNTPLQGRVRISDDEELAEFPFTGEAIADGSESLSVGCKTKFPSITDPCSNTYTNGGYCDLSIYTKKDAQDKVPSSMFSGKLRLFVQAIYGSTRSNYQKSGSFDLKIGSYTLTRGFSNSNWLLTTSNYDYFLCTYTGSAIEFREIQLNSFGQQFRDILKTHPRNTEFDFVTKAEAYILATGTIGSTVYATVNITGEGVNGSPLDYGWHAAWDGKEVTIVCFYDDVANARYISNQYQLAIGESWDGSTYTFTAACSRLISDQPFWTFTNGLNIFYYDDASQQMMPLPYPSQTPGGYEGIFSAPIYCYYYLDPTNGTSILKTDSITMNVRDRTPENVLSNEGKHYGADDFTVIDQLIYRATLQGDKGFTVGGNTYNVLVTDVQTKHEWIYAKTSGPTITVPTVNLSGSEPFRDDMPNNTPALWASNEASPAAGEVNPDNPTQHARVKINYYKYNVTRNIRPNIVESGSAFYQTVLGSCSSVVVGTRQEHSSDDISVTNWANVTRGFGCGMYWVRDLDQAVVSGELDAMGGARFLAPLPHNSILSYFTPTTSTTPGDAGSIGIGVSDYVHTETPHSGYSATLDTTNSNEYFSPTTSDPGTNGIDTARGSIGGKSKIEHKLYSNDYGFLNDSSIGWQ